MIKSTINKLRNVLSKNLKNDIKYFSCSLPAKLGKITSFFLNRLFLDIRIQKEQIEIIRNIPKKAIIIFVTMHKSNFEFLFTYIHNKKNNLPTPRLGFDYNIYFFQPILRLLKILKFNILYTIKNRKMANPYNCNYYKEKILNYKCALLSLIEKKGFYLRFVKKKIDPLQHLIKIQLTINEPIYIIPQIMFFDTKPVSSEPSIMEMLFGNSQKPSKIKIIATLLRSPKKIFVEYSEPINLRKWINKKTNKIKKEQQIAISLRQKLLLQHNRHRHVITGPILKTPEEVKESILTNEKMQIFMKIYAKNKKTQLQNVSKKAHIYITEIIAKYNPDSIKIMSLIINWIINLTFDGAVVDKNGLNRIKEISKESPLVLVPCHKSHIDYLILSYILYKNNMPCPHVAAGKNLSFWPLGKIFRSGGAFFIRRSFRGKKLYTKVLSEYVMKLLEEGFNIEMFIEGGRSRTGKLLTPKLGFISILLQAFLKGACKDINFVPVYIGYDRIIEEHAYIHEIEGGRKKPENFSQIIKAIKFLKRRYGKIYINFHEPISLKKLILKNESIFNFSKNTEINICQNIGNRIITAIAKKTVITPHGLTAAAILNLSKHKFNYKEVIETANSYLFFAISQKAKISDTLSIASDQALENAFNEYKNRKLIEEIKHFVNDNSTDTPYTVKNNKRSLLEFYKNNSICYFIHGAIVSLAILKKDAFQFCASDLHEDHKNLLLFFKYEFAIDFKKTSEFFVRKTIKAFIDDAMLMPHKTLPDTYNITSIGYRKLKLYAIFLKPYFESYLVVIQFINRNNNKIKNFNNKEKLKKIQFMGLKMHKNGEIDLIESVSKNNYANGIKFFSNLKSKNNFNLVNLKKYHKFITKHLKLINT